MNKLLKLTSCLFTISLLTSCGGIVPVANSSSDAPSPAVITQNSNQQHPEVGEIELKVMTFNIWIGGEVVDFHQVIEAIRQSDADIVGLQEAEGNTARIAAALGWYADERLMVISRYPVIEPPEAQSDTGVDYVYVQIAPGQVVAMSNIHLTSDPYGPYAVRDGQALDFVLEQEKNIRLPEIQERLASWQEVISAGIPLFVTGDFNTPSHRDWTSASVGSLPQILYAVEWPVTKEVEAAGFVDTFRAANPDPIADPGRTWSYGYPYPRLNENETIDRIDYVFASGAARVLSSQVIGEPGTPNVDIAITPYPSDHRAVVSTVRVKPVEPPVFVAVEQTRVIAGERLVVRYHAPDEEGIDRLAIVRAGGAIPADEIMWLPPQEAVFFGAVRFGTGGLEAGEYHVVLVGKDDQELARQRFWLVAPDAKPVVFTSKPDFASGESITVEWLNAPARMRDWIGIYPAGNLDIYNAYLSFAYTGATVSGQRTFGADDLGDAMLPPGDYIAVLVSDDGYAILAKTSFSVVP